MSDHDRWLNKDNPLEMEEVDEDETTVLDPDDFPTQDESEWDDPKYRPLVEREDR